jgi:hypothetical protein
LVTSRKVIFLMNVTQSSTPTITTTLQ